MVVVTELLSTVAEPRVLAARREAGYTYSKGWELVRCALRSMLRRERISAQVGSIICQGVSLHTRLLNDYIVFTILKYTGVHIQ